MVCQRLSKIELPAAKVNGFQCKDIVAVPDPPLITIFGKVILI